MGESLIVQKEPREFMTELEKRGVALVLLDSVDIGTAIAVIVAENAKRIAEALGLKCREIRARPYSHRPWEADIDFVLEDGRVLRAEVKTCTLRTSILPTIRVVKRYLARDHIGIIAFPVGYKKPGRRRHEVGLAMFVVTREFADRHTASQLYELLEEMLEEKARREGYEALYPTNFRDKVILRAFAYGVLAKKRLKRLEREVADIKARMATKQDVESVQSRMGGLQGQIAELQAEVTGLKGEVAELKAEVTGLKGEVADIKARMATKQDVEALRRDFRALSERMDAIEELLKRVLRRLESSEKSSEEEG